MINILLADGGLMMRAEILAPAGNREAFEAAFAAGADAVYMGLPKFGARAYAANFGMSEMKEVIHKAHLAGMKIYITMNTILEESEILEAAALAEEVSRAGADALIIQDLGLIHYLHHTLPEIELHASTQVSVNRPEQIEKLKQLGVTRVVLAREATLEEIKACKKAGLELEVFVHGALCISYSGQCQFSRIRYGRSGNKGSCAQPCRMEYTLLKNGKPVHASGTYLLSPKDLSILQDIPALQKAGVDSLKIEGRMKSPVYVYESVLKARKAQKGIHLSDQDIRELSLAYSRGFTRGHTFNKRGNDLMNSHSGSHQGIEIGKVVRISKDRIQVELSDDLHQDDGIRFDSERSSTGCRVNFLYSKDGRLKSSAKKGETVQIPFVKGVFNGARVLKTVDSLLEKEVKREVQQTKRQRSVHFELIADGADKPVLLRVLCGPYEAQIERMIAQNPVKRPTAEDDFIKQLSKTGNSFAKTKHIDVTILEPVFVPLKELNRLRDDVLDLLAKQILKPKEIDRKDYDFQINQVRQMPNLLEIQKPQQVINSTELNDDDNQNSKWTIISQFPIQNTHREASLSDQQGLVGVHLGEAPIVSGMNITNSYALAALLEMGYEGAILSPELSDEGRKEMIESFESRYHQKAPVILPVYGANQMMLMNHCPINTALKDGTRKECAECRKADYRLEGKDGKRAWLYGDPKCRMQVFDEDKVDHIDEIQSFKEQGIDSFLLSMSDEDKNQTRQVLERFSKHFEV